MELKLKCLNVFDRLVSFDTTSVKSNLQLIHWVEFYLKQFGAETRLTISPENNKANLFATFKAFDGNENEGGIIFSGHTDIVPVEGQDWKTDPFKLHIGNGKAYGRGTADMKGFIAVILSYAELISKTKLKIPFHFALSYDEEVGCVGVRHLLRDIKVNGIKPKYCIVGEPSLMQIVTGHKGQVSYKCRVIGHESHSSLTHQGVNAVEYAAELISFIRKIALKEKNSGNKDTLFDPSFNTINVGVIQGGTAINIVPNSCEFMFETRYLPGNDPTPYLSEIFNYAQNVLLPEMKAIYPDADIIFEKIVDYPSFRIVDDAEFVSFIKSVTGANQLDTVPYGAEAGLFHKEGIETVICGPGNIEQAHKANEFITLDQLQRCENLIEKLILHFKA